MMPEPEPVTPESYPNRYAFVGPPQSVDAPDPAPPPESDDPAT
jgi:hypothetical protein